jgi:hypothetical protein
MPKDDAIGAPREIPANRLLLGLRTGLRSGAIGALRTQMTGGGRPPWAPRAEGKGTRCGDGAQRGRRRCLRESPAKLPTLGRLRHRWTPFGAPLIS